MAYFSYMKNAFSFLSSAANSVGTSLEFPVLMAAVSTPNIAELVPSVFSFFTVHNFGFCDGENTFSQEKTLVLSIESLLSCEKI